MDNGPDKKVFSKQEPERKETKTMLPYKDSQETG
jgi:hypothetical protein